MTPRFKFQMGDIVMSNNLPIDIIDKGFSNSTRYKVRFGWLDDLKQAYYIQCYAGYQQMLQSADGIPNGYASYFSIDNEKSVK
jgi:hypothetical protein